MLRSNKITIKHLKDPCDIDNEDVFQEVTAEKKKKNSVCDM